MIYASIAGAYPQIGIDSKGHDLRAARHDFDRGLTTLEHLEEIEDRVVFEVVKEQENAGMDFITDGLVRWKDPVSHIAGRMDGVEEGELHHLYWTNFHVRKAVVNNVPVKKSPFIKGDVDFTKTCTTKKVLPVLPSINLLMKYTESKSVSPEAIKEAYEKAYEDEECLVGSIFTGVFQGYQVFDVVSVRSALMENPKEVADRIAGLLIPGTPVILKPDWWLDVLPRRYAYKKMEIIAQIRDILCA